MTKETLVDVLVFDDLRNFFKEPIFNNPSLDFNELRRYLFEKGNFTLAKKVSKILASYIDQDNSLSITVFNKKGGFSDKEPEYKQAQSEFRRKQPYSPWLDCALHIVLDNHFTKEADSLPGLILTDLKKYGIVKDTLEEIEHLNLKAKYHRVDFNDIIKELDEGNDVIKQDVNNKNTINLLVEKEGVPYRPFSPIKIKFKESERRELSSALDERYGLQNYFGHCFKLKHFSLYKEDLGSCCPSAFSVYDLSSDDLCAALPFQYCGSKEDPNINPNELVSFLRWNIRDKYTTMYASRSPRLMLVSKKELPSVTEACDRLGIKLNYILQKNS